MTLTGLAFNPPTRVVGNGVFTNCLVIATGNNPSSPKMYSLVGYSGTAQYLMIFETNAIPTNGSVCKLGPFPIDAGKGFSFNLSYYGADLDKMTVCNSTTTNVLTIGASDCTFQAVVAK